MLFGMHCSNASWIQTAYMALQPFNKFNLYTVHAIIGLTQMNN